MNDSDPNNIVGIITWDRAGDEVVGYSHTGATSTDSSSGASSIPSIVSETWLELDLATMGSRIDFYRELPSSDQKVYVKISGKTRVLGESEQDSSDEETVWLPVENYIYVSPFMNHSTLSEIQVSSGTELTGTVKKNWLELDAETAARLKLNTPAFAEISYSEEHMLPREHYVSKDKAIGVAKLEGGDPPLVVITNFKQGFRAEAAGGGEVSLQEVAAKIEPQIVSGISAASQTLAAIFNPSLEREVATRRDVALSRSRGVSFQGGDRLYVNPDKLELVLPIHYYVQSLANYVVSPRPDSINLPNLPAQLRGGGRRRRKQAGGALTPTEITALQDVLRNPANDTDEKKYAAIRNLVITGPLLSSTFRQNPSETTTEPAFTNLSNFSDEEKRVLTAYLNNDFISLRPSYGLADQPATPTQAAMNRRVTNAAAVIRGAPAADPGAGAAAAAEAARQRAAEAADEAAAARQRAADEAAADAERQRQEAEARNALESELRHRAAANAALVRQREESEAAIAESEQQRAAAIADLQRLHDELGNIDRSTREGLLANQARIDDLRRAIQAARTAMEAAEADRVRTTQSRATIDEDLRRAQEAQAAAEDALRRARADAATAASERAEIERLSAETSRLRRDQESITGSNFVVLPSLITKVSFKPFKSLVKGPLFNIPLVKTKPEFENNTKRPYKFPVKLLRVDFDGPTSRVVIRVELVQDEMSSMYEVGLYDRITGSYKYYPMPKELMIPLVLQVNKPPAAAAGAPPPAAPGAPPAATGAPPAATTSGAGAGAGLMATAAPASPATSGAAGGAGGGAGTGLMATASPAAAAPPAAALPTAVVAAPAPAAALPEAVAAAPAAAAALPTAVVAAPAPAAALPTAVVAAPAPAPAPALPSGAAQPDVFDRYIDRIVAESGSKLPPRAATAAAPTSGATALPTTPAALPPTTPAGAPPPAPAAAPAAAPAPKTVSSIELTEDDNDRIVFTPILNRKRSEVKTIFEEIDKLLNSPEIHHSDHEMELYSDAKNTNTRYNQDINTDVSGTTLLKKIDFTDIAIFRLNFYLDEARKLVANRAPAAAPPPTASRFTPSPTAAPAPPPTASQFTPSPTAAPLPQVRQLTVIQKQGLQAMLHAVGRIPNSITAETMAPENTQLATEIIKQKSADEGLTVDEIAGALFGIHSRLNSVGWYIRNPGDLTADLELLDTKIIPKVSKLPLILAEVNKYKGKLLKVQQTIATPPAPVAATPAPAPVAAAPAPAPVAATPAPAPAPAPPPPPRVSTTSPEFEELYSSAANYNTRIREAREIAKTARRNAYMAARGWSVAPTDDPDLEREMTQKEREADAREAELERLISDARPVVTKLNDTYNVNMMDILDKPATEMEQQRYYIPLSGERQRRRAAPVAAAPVAAAPVAEASPLPVAAVDAESMNGIEATGGEDVRKKIWEYVYDKLQLKPGTVPYNATKVEFDNYTNTLIVDTYKDGTFLIYPPDRTHPEDAKYVKICASRGGSKKCSQSFDFYIKGKTASDKPTLARSMSRRKPRSADGGGARARKNGRRRTYKKGKK